MTRRRISRRPGLLTCAALAVGILLAAGCSSSTSTGGPAESRVINTGACASVSAAPPLATVRKAATKTTASVQITGTSLVAEPAGPGDQAIGCAAPIVDGQDFAGNPIRIGGPTTKPTVVVIAAHWCPHCNNEVPKVVDWVKAGGLADKVHVVILSTGVDSGGTNYPPATWLSSKMGWSGATMADSDKGEAGTALGISGFPSFLLLTAQGHVADRMSGEQPIATFETKVRELIATSEAEPATTVPATTEPAVTTTEPAATTTVGN